MVEGTNTIHLHFYIGQEQPKAFSKEKKNMIRAQVIILFLTCSSVSLAMVWSPVKASYNVTVPVQGTKYSREI